jgi:protein tyrosine phosphatase (PTP) superfamily phosphohydrolase (DUF442 family)
VALGIIGWRWVTGNVGTVEPGRIYRSAQLSPGALTRIIRDRRIKTVLNLRGCNPDQTWYRAERAATLAAGAAQVDVPMSSDQWLSRDQARTLVEVLDSGAYPLLIHCEWGAERTGLVAAIATLLRPGSTLANARAQFSPYYLFVRLKDGRVMAGHLDGYEAWLGQRRLTHAPDRFRRWLAEVYRPGSPSREYWPYNPYPLVVVTRPSAADRSQQSNDAVTIARRVRETHQSRSCETDWCVPRTRLPAGGSLDHGREP